MWPEIKMMLFRMRGKEIEEHYIHTCIENEAYGWGLCIIHQMRG